MADREKLVELLDIIIQPGQKTLGEIADHLIAHGVTVREPKRPLLLGELVALCDKGPHAIYTERRNQNLGDEMSAITPNVGKRSGKGYIITHANGYKYRFYFGDYGIKWRCWAEKPTDEEREAAEWE